MDWLVRRDGTAIPEDAIWTWGTIALIAAVSLGYTVIAFKWYLQRKLEKSDESKSTFIRLIALATVSALCGASFCFSETPFFIWRLYDLLLAGIALHTWLFLWRIRGVTLIDEEVAERHKVAEREKQAREKAFLLKSLGHDLRSPLHSVILNAESLKILSRDPEILESAQAIIEGAKTAASLIEKLLDYAKIGSQDENELSTVSLGALARQIERRFAPVAAEKGITLVAQSVDADLVTDRSKLERIVNNVVDNALKFTANGWVEVAISRANGAISIKVSDTGVGIPPESIGHLFEEFYQAGNQDKARSRGFGMGLAICRCLARQLGGDIRVASTGPQGTCFEIRIPDQRTQTEGRRAASRPAVIAASPA